MELKVNATQNAPKKGKAQIAKRKKDLAIRRCFMSHHPLRQRSLPIKMDLPADCHDKSDARKDEEDQSVNHTSRKELGNSAKRRLEECTSEPSTPEQPKPNGNSVDDQKAGPSGIWTSTVSSNPLKLVLKKVGPPNAKPEDQHPPTEKEEPENMNWLYDEVSRLPIDAPIPEPDLSFLDK